MIPDHRFNFIKLTTSAGVNYLIAFCLIYKLGYISYHIVEILSHPVDSYELGESLLNYYQGFQRRSLLGTIVIGISKSAPLIQTEVKLFGIAGLACLFLLLKRYLGKITPELLYLVVVIICCSPFGLPFYSVWFLKKEAIFFIILFAGVLGFKVGNLMLRFVLLDLLVVAGCLIHEGFVFMGLPILLCLAYLKGNRLKFILSMVTSAMLTILAISFLSVHPEPAATNYILSMNHIGLDTTTGFTHPVNYMRMGHMEFFQNLMRKITVSSIGMFSFFYTINTCCIYFLFKYQLLSTTPLVRKKMVWCLFAVHIAAFPLFFMGLDYGRWLSFTFLAGCLVLIESLSTEVGKGFFPYRDKKTNGLWVFFSIYCVLIKIPIITEFNRYSLVAWGKTFMTFMK